MTPIPEIIFSGFVSKAVNDIVDVSKDKIRKAVINKNAKHKNIESQIYNVIVDVLNKNSYNQYENNQDKIYDAADALLRSFKENKGDNVRNIQSCLRILGLKADENGCLEFKVSLYEELGRDEYGELFHAILLLLLDQKSQYDNAVYEQLNQKLDEVNLKINKLDQKLDDIHKKQDDTIIQEKDVEFQNNKKQKYIENWNSRLFLHVDNNENPLTLADAFIMPDYKMYKSVARIGFSQKDTLDKIIEKFINYDKTSTMLITGVPGIGKSSITSWIANKYKNDDNVIVLRFRDWKREELEAGLIDAICVRLVCESDDLENLVLVLDGFDEMKALDIREKLLADFMNEIKDFKNFKCIIMSRPDYISYTNFQNYIKLKVFDLGRIERFHKIVSDKNIEEIKRIESNLEVLGIPVILYMAIMSNVDISQNPTKPELYNRIFSEEGGIFDKFCYNGVGYDVGQQILRSSQNIKKYLKFLGEVAFAMFEKDDLSLAIEECKIPILIFQGKPICILEFPIKHLFENTITEIEFIHKSIYEYFVSEYIFIGMEEGIYESKEKIAEVLGKSLSLKRLPDEILDFLRFRINNSKLNNELELINGAFELMLQDGMTYYTNECYKNVIQCEANIFANMLDILHMWKDFSFKFNDSVCCYLRLDNENLNLKETDLSKMDLSRINLKGAFLKNTNFKDTILKGADLSKADFCETNLVGADLFGVSLTGTDINNAIF